MKLSRTLQKMEEINVSSLEFPKDKINNYRVKIDTGFSCQAKCYYCYYRDHLNDPFIDSEIVYKQIDKAKKLGFKKMEFSGGESSYHPDFFKWLKYCKDNNLEASTLTNGLLFNEDFLKKAKENGLSEILLSFHGYNEIHDKIIGHENAYKNSLNLIKLCDNYDIKLRVNIVVNEKMINEIIFLIHDLTEYKNIAQYNFLPLNHWDFATNIRYNPYQKEMDLYQFNIAISMVKILHKDFNIRYIPYHLIPEENRSHIKNIYDHFFDKDDWFPLFTHYSDILNFEYDDIYQPELFKKHILENRLYTQFYKIKECLSCKYTKFCDGMKK